MLTWSFMPFLVRSCSGLRQQLPWNVARLLSPVERSIRELPATSFCLHRHWHVLAATAMKATSRAHRCRRPLTYNLHHATPTGSAGKPVANCFLARRIAQSICRRGLGILSNKSPQGSDKEIPVDSLHEVLSSEKYHPAMVKSSQPLAFWS